MRVSEFIERKVYRVRRWVAVWLCRAIGHVWKLEGGKQCPHEMKGDVCSMSVYRCERCGEYDYGYEGGLAHEECLECPNSRLNKPTAALLEGT